MRLDPYLMFHGQCEEAMRFYCRALGTKIEMLMPYSDSPADPSDPNKVPAGWENKVMHGSFRVGDVHVMASDTWLEEEARIGGFSLSLSLADADVADRVFAALAEGGTIKMPLGQTFWSPLFGMLTDRFGVSWMVSVATGA